MRDLYYHAFAYERLLLNGPGNGYTRGFVLLKSFDSATEMEQWVLAHPDKVCWLVPMMEKALYPGEFVGGCQAAYWNGVRWGVGYMVEAELLPRREENDLARITGQAEGSGANSGGVDPANPD